MSGGLAKLFDGMAKAGVWFRLNDPRHEPPSEAGREWGPEQDGFALSLKALGPDTVSVFLKNLGTGDRLAQIPDWLGYYTIEIPAELKSYGREVLRAAREAAPAERVFRAGKILATEIPIGALYDLRKPGEYRVSVSAPVPGGAGMLRSNEVVMTSSL